MGKPVKFELEPGPNGNEEEALRAQEALAGMWDDNSLALIDYDAAVDAAARRGYTALFLVANKYDATEGHSESARLLLAHGGDPNRARPADGRTPLMMAALRGNEEIVRLAKEYAFSTGTWSSRRSSGLLLCPAMMSTPPLAGPAASAACLGTRPGSTSN